MNNDERKPLIPTRLAAEFVLGTFTERLSATHRSAEKSDPLP